VKLHALKGVELPVKVLSFYRVPLNPALEGGVKGHLPAKPIPEKSSPPLKMEGLRSSKGSFDPNTP
jgi:hypothetical protein